MSFRHTQSVVLAALNEANTLATRFHNPVEVTVSVEGTFTATLRLEATCDGINWYACAVCPSTAPATPAADITAAGLYMAVRAPNASQFRVAAFNYTSGSAVVILVILPVSN